jgi:excisionase family DNA binding protein
MNPKEILTTSEAAEYLGRSDGAIRNLVLRRAIPYRKPGGRLTFLRSELDEWIDTAPGVRVDDILRKGDR